jgi:hypothetical protein
MKRYTETEMMLLNEIEASCREYEATEEETKEVFALYRPHIHLLRGSKAEQLFRRMKQKGYAGGKVRMVCDSCKEELDRLIEKLKAEFPYCDILIKAAFFPEKGIQIAFEDNL